MTLYPTLGRFYLNVVLDVKIACVISEIARELAALESSEDLLLRVILYVHSIIIGTLAYKLKTQVI